MKIVYDWIIRCRAHFNRDGTLCGSAVPPWMFYPKEHNIIFGTSASVWGIDLCVPGIQPPQASQLIRKNLVFLSVFAYDPQMASN